MKATRLLVICFATFGLISIHNLKGPSDSETLLMIFAGLKFWSYMFSYVFCAYAFEKGTHTGAAHPLRRARPYLRYVGVGLGIVSGCAYVLSLSLAYGINLEKGAAYAVIAQCFCYGAGYLVGSRHGKPVQANSPVETTHN